MPYFASVPVPREIGKRLQTLQAGARGAVWHPAEKFHITLAYYGDLASTRELETSLDQLKSMRLQLQLGDLGWFDGSRKRAALFVSVNSNARLDALADACRRAAPNFGDRQSQPYRPHVTLAYMDHTDEASMAAWRDFQAESWQQQKDSARWIATEFTLNRSGTPRAAQNPSGYETIATYQMLSL